MGQSYHEVSSGDKRGYIECLIRYFAYMATKEPSLIDMCVEAYGDSKENHIFYSFI